MIKRPYREHHLLTLLEEYEKQHLPLDLFISLYFRAHKSLGSKDRGTIAENVYAMVRWKGLLDYLCEGSATWEKRWQLYSKINIDNYLKDENIPLYTRLSFPEKLFQLIVQSHGKEKASQLCQISNQPAPTTIRVNTLKCSREELLKRWDQIYKVTPCAYSETGIRFLQKTNFFTLPEFQSGFFEVQDEGSQLLADKVQAEPGQLVMDYCSGSGGKTLAFAPKMQGKGQIFLHDIRPYALKEAKKRLRRAGIQNSQVVFPDDPKLSKLKKKMDWVLVDVPCSGTGTMRRNPDMKWNFTEETLQRLVGQQRMIFEKALSFLKPGGKIVYGTCSLLKQENQDQLEHFLKTYPLEVEGEIFQSLPSEGGMDGFFGVTLHLKNS